MRVGHSLLGGFFSLAVLAVGCGEDDAASARRAIRERHIPRAIELVRQDLASHRAGIAAAASRLAPGFVVDDPATRERQMRTALKRVQEVPRGIREFVASPMSFLAAVGRDGRVIARDAEPDKMRGEDFGTRFPLVRAALERGVGGDGLVEFPAAEEGGAVDPAFLFVHPAWRNGEVVGAVVAGIPLWRMAQRLGRQLQVEHASEVGLVLWAYLYRGDALHRFGTPPEVDGIVPDAPSRAQGLRASPGGFTGARTAFHRTYGFGVRPLPFLGADLGIVVVRSDPP